MKPFLLSVLGTGLANIISFLIYQGFVHSKIGSNFREEASRWFNQIFNMWKKHGL